MVKRDHGDYDDVVPLPVRCACLTLEHAWLVPSACRISCFGWCWCGPAWVPVLDSSTSMIYLGLTQYIFAWVRINPARGSLARVQACSQTAASATSVWAPLMLSLSMKMTCCSIGSIRGMFGAAGQAQTVAGGLKLSWHLACVAALPSSCEPSRWPPPNGNFIQQ